MSALVFTRNEQPSIGVELELQLVDAESFALTNRIEDVLANVAGPLLAAHRIGGLAGGHIVLSCVPAG